MRALQTWLVGFSLLLSVSSLSCRHGYETACAAVDCSGHGVCLPQNDATGVCACDTGYHNDGPVACVPDECDADGECDDNNVCTSDACEDGVCTFLPVEAACDDGLFCTAEDRCEAGVCTGSGQTCGADLTCDETRDACLQCLEDRHCDDGNVCSDNLCIAGFCATSDNTAPCDDGLFCTLIDACDSFDCQGSGDRCPGLTCDEQLDACTGCENDFQCDDGNVCTLDRCVAGTCLVEHIDSPCDDGSVCTTDDRCAEGRCVGDPVLCDDGNDCTYDFCDPLNGCWHEFNFLPCDDGDPCTIEDVCQEGVCTGHENPCDDGNVCTDDACLSATGCTHLNNSGPCDDGNDCTTGDHCLDGECLGDLIDVDMDSFPPVDCGGTDCLDTDPDVNPDAPEGQAVPDSCLDGLDNDCDGFTDGQDDGCLSPCVWTLWSMGSTFPQFSDMWGIASSDIWAVSSYSGHTAYRFDGNEWWSASGGNTTPLHGVWVSEAGDVWAVGDAGTILQREGESWITHDVGEFRLNAIWGSAPDDIWAVGDQGAIFHLSGGADWEQMSAGSQDLLGVFGTSANDVWVVGSNTTVLRWTGGPAWEPVATPPGLIAILEDVWASGPEDAWAVGSGGTILRWTGGTQWSYVYSDTEEWLYAIWGGTEVGLWAVGGNGTILERDMSGTWLHHSAGSANDLQAIWGTSRCDAWAAGLWGTMARLGTPSAP